VETKTPGFEDAFFSNQVEDSFSGNDRYEKASSIADDLRTALLAELEIGETMGEWEKDLLLLSDYTWVRDCGCVAERLIRLREISPLDIIGVSALTDQVCMRPFLCSLAMALTKFLQRVVLIDCDLRSPSLHTVVGAEGKEGFIDMVKYGCSFFTAASQTETEGIYVIGAGSHPVSSEGELVGRELERVFHSLRAKADITLACVPPFLLRKQVNPILNCMDGVLLCLNGSVGRKSNIRRGFSALWKSDIPVLGIIAQKPSHAEERQILVLRAQAEEVQSPTPQTPSVENVGGIHKTFEGSPDSCDVSEERNLESAESGKVGVQSGEVVSRIETAHEKDFSEEGGTAQETGPPSHEPISFASEDGVSERSISEESGFRETARGSDSEVVERALFGKQGQWRHYVVGICAVLGIVGVLALKQARFPGSASSRMDERMMRSILLPGSDGVMTGDETPRSRTGVMSDVSAPFGSPNDGRSRAFYVQISSRANYNDALRDSLKVVGVGLRVFTLHVEEDGQGSGYKVVLGPFLTVDEAKAAVSRIEPLELSAETKIITEGVRE
jgi:non-specific protein-tyrosine kinase